MAGPHSMIRNLENISENSDGSMGNLGGQYSGAATLTPAALYNFTAVQIITDAVVSCVGNVSGLTTISLSAGVIIYGSFTSVVITSGTVIVYNGLL